MNPFKNDLFRQNLFFYLETNGRRFGSMNKSLAGFAVQEGADRYIVALNLGEPKYPGIDGGESKAWGQFYGQKEFEWLTGQTDPESATMTYQVLNAITGEVYGMGEDRKPYPFWMLAQVTLPVGVPSPDIQILKLRAAGEMKPEEKRKQLASHPGHLRACFRQTGRAIAPAKAEGLLAESDLLPAPGPEELNASPGCSGIGRIRR